MQSKLLTRLQPDHQTRPHGALSEEVIFQSPVKDYRGPADVAHILSTIGDVLDQIDAQRELAADREVVTIITAVYGGEQMDGVLHETHDAAGRVDCATLLLRPLSTLRHAIDGMVAALEQSPLPSKVGERLSEAGGPGVTAAASIRAAGSVAATPTNRA